MPEISQVLAIYAYENKRQKLQAQEKSVSFQVIPDHQHIGEDYS